MDPRLPLALLTFALALVAWVLVVRSVRRDGWDALEDDVREEERARRDPPTAAAAPASRESGRD